MRLLACLLCLALAACARPAVVVVPAAAPPEAARAIRDPSIAARDFIAVVERVMPVAVEACRAQRRAIRCDYGVVVDDRLTVPPNAFQTVAPDGRPIVGFTLPLILLAENPDELAFVLSHEAAHHIAGHITRGEVSARQTAALAAAVATLRGGDAVAIRRARDIGAFVGARRYSKDFELEADALGARIALAAGFDPLRGIGFFYDGPDPGNEFLGTHPPNADRIATVRAVVAGG
ncbi:peptidase M48 [Palleronia sediminis]|uniref:Peptidase M48 n=1 Tax=Palleronia sediminis TaxID=2547833 RepID=A0A4R6A5K8_9RHOB|nr:M48 family metallopeptidase [Palleronia sediminis]TDL76053.1 peptidase M48 [Palleronia sediminis]